MAARPVMGRAHAAYWVHHMGTASSTQTKLSGDACSALQRQLVGNAGSTGVRRSAWPDSLLPATRSEIPGRVAGQTTPYQARRGSRRLPEAPRHDRVRSWSIGCQGFVRMPPIDQPTPLSPKQPTPAGSLDGRGAGDHDLPYHFGRQPRAVATYPFSTRQFARLLVLRGKVAADLLGAEERAS